MLRVLALCCSLVGTQDVRIRVKSCCGPACGQTRSWRLHSKGLGYKPTSHHLLSVFAKLILLEVTVGFQHLESVHLTQRGLGDSWRLRRLVAPHDGSAVRAGAAAATLCFTSHITALLRAFSLGTHGEVHLCY